VHRGKQARDAGNMPQGLFKIAATATGTKTT